MKYSSLRKGEIITGIVVGGLVVMGAVSILASAFTRKPQQTTTTRAAAVQCSAALGQSCETYRVIGVPSTKTAEQICSEKGKVYKNNYSCAATSFVTFVCCGQSSQISPGAGSTVNTCTATGAQCTNYYTSGSMTASLACSNKNMQLDSSKRCPTAGLSQYMASACCIPKSGGGTAVSPSPRPGGGGGVSTGNPAAGVCRDRVVAAGTGAYWKADCTKRCSDVSTHSDCPANANDPSGNPATSHWCYLFSNGAYCMQRVAEGSGTNPPANPPPGDGTQPPPSGQDSIGARDNDGIPGGYCDKMFNDGCGGNGCRSWERCESNYSCTDTTNRGANPPAADACGDRANVVADADPAVPDPAGPPADPGNPQADTPPPADGYVPPPATDPGDTPVTQPDETAPPAVPADQPPLGQRGTCTVSIGGINATIQTGDSYCATSSLKKTCVASNSGAASVKDFACKSDEVCRNLNAGGQNRVAACYKKSPDQEKEDAAKCFYENEKELQNGKSVCSNDKKKIYSCAISYKDGVQVQGGGLKETPCPSNTICTTDALGGASCTAQTGQQGNASCTQADGSVIPDDGKYHCNTDKSASVLCKNGIASSTTCSNKSCKEGASGAGCEQTSPEVKTKALSISVKNSSQGCTEMIVPPMTVEVKYNGSPAQSLPASRLRIAQGSSYSLPTLTLDAGINRVDFRIPQVFCTTATSGEWVRIDIANPFVVQTRNESNSLVIDVTTPMPREDQVQADPVAQPPAGQTSCLQRTCTDACKEYSNGQNAQAGREGKMVYTYPANTNYWYSISPCDTSNTGLGAIPLDPYPLVTHCGCTSATPQNYDAVCQDAQYGYGSDAHCEFRTNLGVTTSCNDGYMTVDPNLSHRPEPICEDGLLRDYKCCTKKNNVAVTVKLNTGANATCYEAQINRGSITFNSRYSVGDVPNGTFDLKRAGVRVPKTEDTRSVVFPSITGLVPTTATLQGIYCNTAKAGELSRWQTISNVVTGQINNGSVTLLVP